MTTIITRAGKGAPLSWAEVDDNFINLNTDKAELVSPTFTGVPAAPTATTGTNTTQLATTAFVQGKTATQTPFTATGNIVATDVQAAIAEVDTEKVAKAGDTMTGQLKGITPVSAEDFTRKDYVDSKSTSDGPAFYAYGGGTATAHGSYVVQLISQIFDTNAAYDPSTGIFNPQVAGYYSVSLTLNFNAASVVATQLVGLYKNDSYYSSISAPTIQTYPNNLSYATLVYLNGTSDYITMKYYQTTGGSITPNSGIFSAFLVRY